MLKSVYLVHLRNVTFPPKFSIKWALLLSEKKTARHVEKNSKYLSFKILPGYRFKFNDLTWDVLLCAHPLNIIGYIRRMSFY